jgi:hypothetical protein
MKSINKFIKGMRAIYNERANKGYDNINMLTLKNFIHYCFDNELLFYTYNKEYINIMLCFDSHNNILYVLGSSPYLVCSFKGNKEDIHNINITFHNEYNIFLLSDWSK